MGCCSDNSVKEKNEQPPNVVDIKIQAKDNQQQQPKDDIKSPKQDISSLAKKGPLLKLPGNNIELVSFTAKNIDYKKMQELELMEHNYLRSLHNAPPLILNEDLNEMAQNYAKELAKKKRMEHSKTRNLKGKEGEWVGENLFSQISSGIVSYTSGDMSKGWYSEIKDYNFKTGQSTGVTGHFTQLIWKDTKEVGFGVAFNGGFCIAVANYFPGGNFNLSTTWKEQILDLLPKKTKSSKELFNYSSVKSKELEVLNQIRKAHQVGSLELDSNLCDLATKHAEDMGKTGRMQVYNNNGNWENWTNWLIMSLIRGANYEGGEGVKKWYKKLEEYDFDQKCSKNKNDSFYVNMGAALIWKPFTKVGFGYYFKDDSQLYICALFDGLVYNDHEDKVFPAK